MNAPIPSSSVSTATTRGAGWLLVAVTLVELVAMAHHPRVRTHDVGDALVAIDGFATVDRLVHGVLIAALLATGFALSIFASRRGLDRPSIRAGAIAYSAGLLAMIGAALVSGFVLPDVATSLPRSSTNDLQIAGSLLIYCRLLNQACAGCATVAMSAGIALWSIDLLADRGLERAIGILGCLVAAVTATLLLAGSLRLDVHGMQQVVIGQGAWSVAIAGSMLRAARREQATMAATAGARQ